MQERIKELRKRLGLSQEAFGAALGVTKAAICTIEAGRRGLTNQMITAICREYNVSEEWLKTGNGEMFNELTRQEYAARLVGKAFATNDEFIINAFIALAELPPEDIKVIKKFIESIKTE